MSVAAIILAAGSGSRFGGDKLSVLLGGKPVWRWSYDAFRAHPSISSVGIVCAAGTESRYSEADFVVTGGANRQESSRLGVEAAGADVVLIHDAARPFVSADGIDRVLAGIDRSGAAAPGVGVIDTLRTRAGTVLDRTTVVAMQTPQGARRDLMLRAHGAGTRDATDDIALIQALGEPVEIVEGDPLNFKITTAADLDRARAIVGGREIRTGFGYDIHPFASDDRPLMLGGIRFEGCPGLDGHSDADVVLHAIVDALLGAAGLGDIGQHFPNADPRWRGEPSLTFLHHADGLLREAGWEIVHVDATIIAEKPKVMPRALEIRTAIANALRFEPARVSIKATTNEGLGAIGRAEGIACHAVATIREH